MTNRHAHDASAGQPSTRPAPAHAALTRPHQGPPGTRTSPPRHPPGQVPPGRSRAPRHRARSAARAPVVTLRDGSPVLIRQIQAVDAPLVADIFGRLSPASRWMRFLAPKNHLTEAELRYLTDIDHHDHEAVAALAHPGGQGLGVARYIRHAHDARAAELAIAVVDNWHRRGLGTELLRHLAYRARRAGIGRFTALTSADNVAMAALLRTVSAELLWHEAGTAEYQIILAPGADHDHD